MQRLILGLLAMVIVLFLSACRTPVEVKEPTLDFSSSSPQVPDALGIEIDSAPLEDGVATKNDVGTTTVDIEPNSLITSPVVITGKTDAGRDELVVELRDQQHATKVKAWAVVHTNPDGLNDFSVKLNFVFHATDEGYIAVYKQKNGQRLDEIEIPVRFQTID